ncbi:MAG: ATP-binding protein [Pseudomonadota bacterium]
MKVTTPNLRTEILLTLLFLLLIGMGLISIVTLKITEGNLVQYPKKLGLSTVQSLQKTIDETGINSTAPLFRNRLKELLSEQIKRMYLPQLFKKIEIIGQDLTVWASSTDTLPPQTTVPHFSFFFQSKKRDIRINQDTLSIMAPLFLGADCIAAANVEVGIDNVRETIGKLHVMLLLYIGLNTFILVIIGNFLLSRIVIKPIERLVKLTDQFEDTNIFTLSTSSGLNEISRLAIALNRMLKKLGENKKLLEAQIESLTKANQKLKEAREEAVRSERLASLGRLAAGVAHEIGNPIGAVLGYTNILLEETKDDEPSKNYLKRIEGEIIRIDSIVRELLDFARPSHSEPVKVDLNLIVNETISFFSHQKIANQVELVLELYHEPLPIWVDSNKIKQVLINLVLNAYDALLEKQGLLNKEEKGWVPILTITTEKASSDHPNLQSYKEKTSEVCALLTVSDTGTGIAGSNLEKIFDPFFTTKSPGKGNGLGLAISLRIVESFNGSIHAESTKGEGSRFTVILPIAGESTN